MRKLHLLSVLWLSTRVSGYSEPRNVGSSWKASGAQGRLLAEVKKSKATYQDCIVKVLKAKKTKPELVLHSSERTQTL